MGRNQDKNLNKHSNKKLKKKSDKNLEKNADRKRLFRIGEVAKMFQISMGTLRHYEKAGILQPEYIDEKSGYRYYGVQQLEVLNTVRYLRVLDFPLAQIADFLKNRDTDRIEEKLVQQKQLIKEKQRELEVIEKKIDHRLEQLRDALHSKLEEIYISQIPENRIVRICGPVKPKSYLDLEYAIQRLVQNQKEALAFMGKVGVGISQERLLKGEFSEYDMVYLTLDKEDCYVGEVEHLPAEPCVAIRFRGSHPEALEHYRKLTTYIEQNHLQITGFARERTLIDYGLTNNTEKFVTEICIPIKISESADTEPVNI